jgi:hypothetical protein
VFKIFINEKIPRVVLVKFGSIVIGIFVLIKKRVAIKL